MKIPEIAVWPVAVRTCYCGFPLEPDQTQCPQCTKLAAPPPHAPEAAGASADSIGGAVHGAMVDGAEGSDSLPASPPVSILASVSAAIENAQLIAADMGGNLTELVLTTEIGRAEVLLMQLRLVRRLVSEVGAVGEQASEIGSGVQANGMEPAAPVVPEDA